MGPSNQQDGGGEQPARPSRHRRHRIAQPSHHRAAELEHCGSEQTPQDTQLEDTAQYVGTGPGDDQGGQHLHGVSEMERKQIADKGWKTEGCRLPVECERHSEGAIRVPQGQEPVVHLGPCQRRPRDEGRNLIDRPRVVDDDARLGRQSGGREEVERAERSTVHQSWHQDSDRCRDEPHDRQPV